jgi:hypothetical protein
MHNVLVLDKSPLIVGTVAFCMVDYQHMSKAAARRPEIRCLALIRQLPTSGTRRS